MLQETRKHEKTLNQATKEDDGRKEETLKREPIF